MPSKPGDEYDGRPVQLAKGGWFIGNADYAEDGTGLSDGHIRNCLQQVYAYCKTNNLRRVICNGILPIGADEIARDQRALLLL